MTKEHIEMANTSTHTHCPVCFRQIRTGKNGKIVSHGKRAYVSDVACKGSGMSPDATRAKIVADDIAIGSKAHLDALSKFFGL